MAMNGNEGGSAYPPNPDVKSGSCLIAGFHALSCTSPSYYNPYRDGNKNTLSVDMVRLSLSFKGDRGEVPNTLSEWALGIANRLGKRMYDPSSLDHLMRQARDASRALEHGREAPRRNHGRNDSAR